MATKQNYVKKMEVKNKQKIDAGIISDRFPSVAGMVIDMTYYHNAENPILMHRTVNFFPESHAFFNLECMIKGCEEGGFDLNRVITRQIKDKKKVIKGEMSCKAKSGDLPANHSSIDYMITINYARKATAAKTKKTATTKIKKAAATKAKKATKTTTRKAAAATKAKKATKTTTRKAAETKAKKATKTTTRKAAAKKAAQTKTRKASATKVKKAAKTKSGKTTKTKTKKK